MINQGLRPYQILLTSWSIEYTRNEITNRSIIAQKIKLTKGFTWSQSANITETVLELLVWQILTLRHLWSHQNKPDSNVAFNYIANRIFWREAENWMGPRGEQASERINVFISKSVFTAHVFHSWVWSHSWFCQICAECTMGCGAWSNRSYANLTKPWSQTKIPKPTICQIPYRLCIQWRVWAKQNWNYKANMFSRWRWCSVPANHVAGKFRWLWFWCLGGCSYLLAKSAALYYIRVPTWPEWQLIAGSKAEIMSSGVSISTGSDE